MKEIIGKSRLREVGEHKVRHKIEITVYRNSSVLESCLQVTADRRRALLQMRSVTDEPLNWLSVRKGVTNKNSNMLCLLERVTSTTHFGEMKDPKALPFLNYQVNLIPGGPVISVRNKTQLILLLDTLRSLQTMRAKNFILLGKDEGFSPTGEKNPKSESVIFFCFVSFF